MVSRNIKQLETELGFPLFTRSGKQLSLTRGGKAFFQWVTELDEASSWGRGTFSRAEAERFTVAFCNLCAAPVELRRAVDELRADYPELALRAASAVETGSLLQRHQISAAVLPEPSALEFSTQPNMRMSAPFGSAPLFLMAESELLEGGQPRWEKLSRKPLVLPEMGKAMEEHISGLCSGLFSERGFAPPEIRLLPNPSSALAQCLCRCGFTLLPDTPETENRSVLGRFQVGEPLHFVVLSQCVPESAILAPLMERLGV